MAKKLTQLPASTFEDLSLLKGYGGKGLFHPIEGFGKNDTITHLFFHTEDIDQARTWALKMKRDGIWPETVEFFGITEPEDLSEYYCPYCKSDQTEFEPATDGDIGSCLVCKKTWTLK